MKMLGEHRFQNSSNFDRMIKRHNMFSKFIFVFIGFIFIMIMAWYLFVGTVAVKTFNYVDKNGMKELVDRVWEGNNK